MKILLFRMILFLVYLLVNIIPIILSSIASLQIGERGVISEESLEIIPLKLLEMGCLPGTEVELLQIAPFNDPIYICVNESHLAIRVATASQIIITKI